RVQDVFLRRLFPWLSNNVKMRRLFYENEENAAFVMEALRQCLQLPYTYDMHVTSAIGLYRMWIKELPHPGFMQDAHLGSHIKLNVHLRSIIRYVRVVFDVPETRPPLETQIKMYQRVLDLYRLMATQDSLNLEVETWHVLLHSIADIAEMLLNRKKRLITEDK